MIRDLNATIPGAPNFRYREFVRSDIATRLGISNIPNKDQWRNIEVLARNVLQPIRNKFGGIKITSGFRSEALNSAINGSSVSKHCNGEAADIEPFDPNISLIEMIGWIHRNLGYYDLIGEYLPDGWIHIAYRKGDNTKKLKIKDSKHNYKYVTIEEIKKLYIV